MSEAEVKLLYEHPANELIAQLQHQHIAALTGSIERSEKVARQLPNCGPMSTIDRSKRMWANENGKTIKAPGGFPQLVGYRALRSQPFTGGGKLKEYLPPRRLMWLR